MTTDLTQFAQNLPADVASMIASDMAADLKRLGSTGGKDAIQVLQNKKFRLPDDSEHDELTVAIVDFVYRNEFYPGAYNPKDIQPPKCAAINADAGSLVPFDESPARQNTSCSGCQQDAWGSSPTGDGKACKNSVHIAVCVPGDDPTGTMLLLKTSPTAITAFNRYVASLARDLKVPPYAVATRIFFDPKSSYASVRFEVAGPNTNLEQTMAFRQDAVRRLNQKIDFTPRAK